MPAAHKSKPAAAKAAAPAAAKPLKKGDHVFLVDGSGYIFRAYHALPPINRKSDGLQLNAVFGFCNMLWKLLRDLKPEERPTHLAVVFDKSEKTFRTEMYPDYKAHRPDPPDDLEPQFKYVREAVHAFDLPCLEQDGFEADDLIATYVREACEAGATATIVSSDKDLMQLVTDGVIMFDTMKDKKIGRAEVIEKFGVPPEKVIEVQALIGDSTDNVPGVPGIGVKTAAQLIGEYGDLETLLFRAPEIKQEKRRQSLIEHAEEARLSKKLVTLDDHVEARCADRRSRGARARLQAADRLPQGDGIQFADAARGGIRQRRRRRGRSRKRASPVTRGERRCFTLSPCGRGWRGAEGAAPGEGAGAAAWRPSPPRAARAGGADIAPPDRGRHDAAHIAGRRPHRQFLGHAADAGGGAHRGRAQRQVRPQQIREQCAASIGSTPGSSAPARPASSRSMPRRPPAIRCRRSCAAFRLRSRPTRPAMCRCRTGRAARARAAACSAARSRRRPDCRSAPRSMRSKPLFTDPGVLKIGHDLKFAWQIFALRGIEIASYDDVMLMSYALDAGRNSHALGPLAEHTFNHAAADLNALIKAGKSKITFDAVGIDRATEYAAERADIVLPALARAQAAACRRARAHRL